VLSLRDWIQEMYLGLMDDGWKLNDIDEMDLYWYIDLLLYKASKEYKTNVANVLNIL